MDDNKLRMRRVLVLSLGIVVLLGCTDRRSDKMSNETSEYKNDITGQIQNLWRTDTLTLFAEYDECGEWGGHIEVFKIYNKSREELWFDYKRDTVDCSGSINENRKWIYKTSDKLTENDQAKIIEYIHDILNEQFKERLPSHSGQYFSIFNNDSTMLISNYGPRHEGFLKLREQLVK